MNNVLIQGEWYHRFPGSREFLEHSPNPGRPVILQNENSDRHQQEIVAINRCYRQLQGKLIILYGRCLHRWQGYEDALCHIKKANTRTLQNLCEDQW